MPEQAENQVAEPEVIEQPQEVEETGASSASTEEGTADSDGTTTETVEGQDPEPEAKPEEKKSRFADRQAQIDKKIWQMNEERRRLREEREAWEKAQVKQDPQQPNINEYDDHEKYLADLEKFNAKRVQMEAEKLAEKRLKEAKEREWFESTVSKYNSKKSIAKEQDPNYDSYDIRVNQIFQAYNASQLIQPLIEMDNSTDIVAHLGRNPDEAERLAQMPPYRALMELGALSSKMAEKPKKRTSSAPPPINPVAGGGNASRSLETMSYRDFEAMRNKQERGL